MHPPSATQDETEIMWESASLWEWEGEADYGRGGVRDRGSQMRKRQPILAAMGRTHARQELTVFFSNFFLSKKGTVTGDLSQWNFCIATDFYSSLIKTKQFSNMFHKFYQVSVTLYCTAKTLYRKFKQKFPEMKLRGLASLFLHYCIFERFIYSQDLSTYFATYS